MNNCLPDQMKKLPCGSTIHHGPSNDRIYLMKLAEDAPKTLPVDLIAFATHQEYSKVFVKVPACRSQLFADAGYVQEASIPQLYNGSDAAVFMGYYLTESRACESDASALDKITDLARRKSKAVVAPLDLDQFTLRQCQEGDVEKMASIYRTVFPTYPFPIQAPSYLLNTMQSHVDYFAAERKGKLIALSSAEMDTSSSAVEMTDFATLPNWRGNSLGVHLLRRMEKKMKLKGIKTAYTIARAVSPAMNITFSKLGYSYGGRLKNNTNISGNIESMNIWYKKIA